MGKSVIERLKVMETGFITDTMKVMGFNGWMTGLHPLNPDHKICGTAFTMFYSDQADPGAKGYSYYELLDSISPGDVIVIAAQGCPYALIGENMQHAASRMGAAGIVLDGKNRDNPIMKRFDLPVFSRGCEVKFMPGTFKMSEYNIRVACAGVTVNPGDYIFGDEDGVIVVPFQHAEAIINLAEQIAEIENEMEIAIKEGKSMKECAAIVAKKKQVSAK